eukprot:1703760-Rhodomonas_salina.1
MGGQQEGAEEAGTCVQGWRLSGERSRHQGGTGEAGACLPTNRGCGGVVGAAEGRRGGWGLCGQEVEVGHQLGCAQQESAALRHSRWEVWVGEDALSWRLALSALA